MGRWYVVGIFLGALVLSFTHSANATRDPRGEHGLDEATTGDRDGKTIRRILEENTTEPDADRIFEKFAKTREVLIDKLQAYGEDVQRLYAAKQSPAEPKVAVALMTELKRLKNERGLVEGLKSKKFDRKEYMSVMVESLVVMQFLEMLAAYGGELNRLSAGRGKLTDADIIARAALKFPQLFGDRKKTWIFLDREVMAASQMGKQMKPVAESLFGPDTNENIYKRAKFFSGFSDNLIEKNKGEIEKYRKDLEERAKELEKLLPPSKK